MTEPRILAIMGSGEAAPTMAKVHRALFEHFGAEPAPAVIIDTPYGFQENADELSARLVEFFRTNLGRRATVASYRSRNADPATLAAAVARIREARYVMAGPGSPSYALRQWAGGPIPEALADKLERGGIVTMASAAALTLGVVTVPVYEIYKVGEDPHWLEGLDLLGRVTGLRAAVVPHYDNAEGGSHDTRFCYLGERRLRILEAALPEGAFILGVDGHTALVLDLGRGTASVAGLGGVTVRVGGRSRVLPAGSEVPIDALGEIARQLAAGAPVEAPVGAGSSELDRRRPRGGASSRAPVPVRDAMVELEASFLDALGRGDVHAAVEALLELDEAISARLRAGEDSPDLDNARAVFRSCIVRLGEQAEVATRDPRDVVAPFVTALLDLRSRARSERDWSTADLIRDRLRAAGVEVHDSTEGSTWSLEEGGARHERPDRPAEADTLPP